MLYVRDQMVYPSMPRYHADKLMPLFLTFFTFILFCNLLGLVPLPAIGGKQISGTATANINVTAGLALITFFTMVGGGMAAVGPKKFWTSLVPHGVPGFVVPIMFLIEVIGLVIKAFALTIRLFANMIAGHLVILSFFGLVFFFANTSHAHRLRGDGPRRGHVRVHHPAGSARRFHPGLRIHVPVDSLHLHVRAPRALVGLGPNPELK